MASHDTLQAVSLIVDPELPTAMDKVMLDLERARMEREDFRQGKANVSGYFPETANDNFSWTCQVIRNLDNEVNLERALMRVRRWVGDCPRMAKYRKRQI